MSSRGFISTVGVFAALCGCSGVETGLQLQLTRDSTLNTEQQILTRVDTLVLVLDSPSGFAGAGSAGQAHGELSAADVDQDGKLELTLRRDLGGALPLLRLLPGNNAGASFKITARGLQKNQTTAVGGVSAASFTEGQVRDLSVPFNLRASFRPPRVLFSLPHNGQTAPRALNQVYLEFSKVVSPGKDQLRLVYKGTAQEVAVPGAWQLSQHTVFEMGLPETRTTATLKLPATCSLNPGTYRIEAASQIKDATGDTLDQDVSTAAGDRFVASFSIAGAPAAAACGLTKETCKNDADCGKVTGFVCKIASGETEGKCVPGQAKDCSKKICPNGYVCEATKSGPQCVPDCRVYGGCDAKSYCDKDTGVCKACADSKCPGDDVCKKLCGDICAKDPKACDDCLKKNGCKPPPA